MTLAEYIQARGISPAEFGSRIGISQAAIWRYMHGRVPSSSIMVKILNETGAHVTPNDFFLEAIADARKRRKG